MIRVMIMIDFFQDFCLAHLFTDIKFEGGILGLAYVGSPRRNSVGKNKWFTYLSEKFSSFLTLGGICTPEYFKNGYGQSLIHVKQISF